MGNPRKDFSLSVSITPINQKIEDQIDLSDIKRKNVPRVWRIPGTIIKKHREEVLKMNDKPPSIQEWRDLYDAVIEFKKKECWNWMWDTDIFGVQNPVTGERRYTHSSKITYGFIRR